MATISGAQVRGTGLPTWLAYEQLCTPVVHEEEVAVQGNADNLALEDGRNVTKEPGGHRQLLSRQRAYVHAARGQGQIPPVTHLQSGWLAFFKDAVGRQLCVIAAASRDMRLREGCFLQDPSVLARCVWLTWIYRTTLCWGPAGYRRSGP